MANVAEGDDEEDELKRPVAEPKFKVSIIDEDAVVTAGLKPFVGDESLFIDVAAVIDVAVADVGVMVGIAAEEPL